MMIREARPDDGGAIQQLLDELQQATGNEGAPFSEEVFAELLSGARGRVLVAEKDARLLGMATVSYNLALRYDGEYCQLEELVVSPAARGLKLGARLIEQTIADARQRGCAEFGLYLVESTEHNRPFYEKFGFTAVGTEMRQSLL